MGAARNYLDVAPGRVVYTLLLDGKRRGVEQAHRHAALARGVSVWA
jgi:hypothetical protein